VASIWGSTEQGPRIDGKCQVFNLFTFAADENERHNNLQPFSTPELAAEGGINNCQ